MIYSLVWSSFSANDEEPQNHHYNHHNYHHHHPRTGATNVWCAGAGPAPVHVQQDTQQ